MEQTFTKGVQFCQMVYEKNEICKSNKNSTPVQMNSTGGNYSSYKPNGETELPNYMNNNEQSTFYVDPTTVIVNPKVTPNDFQWKICQDLMQYQTNNISSSSLTDKNYLIIGKPEDMSPDRNIVYGSNLLINQTNNIPLSVQHVPNSRNSHTNQSKNEFIINETKNISSFDNCTQTSPINEISKKKVKLKTEVLDKINQYRTRKKGNCNYYETHKIEISQKRRVFYELNKEVIRLKRRTIYETRKDIYNMKRRDRYRKQKNNNNIRLQKSDASELINTKVTQSDTDESSFDTVFIKNNSNLGYNVNDDTANPLRPSKANWKNDNNKIEDDENKRRKKEMNRLYYQKHKDMIKLRRRSSYEMKKDMYNMKRRDRYNRIKQNTSCSKTKENFTTNKAKEQMNDSSQFNGIDILDKQKLYHELHKTNISMKRKDYYEANKALIFEKAKTYYESQLKKLS